ncbi:MAG: ATP-dependent Clp protease adaptor ClpS [Spirochaetales bacterium]|nr:ATP-dependent Clp protease adaptor ClpS [Spirochaetales bacterium]
MSDHEYKEEVQYEERTAEPPKFKVILLNDDYTTFDFVIRVLVEVFRKPEPEAIQITMDVHKRGYGICGIYTKEIAETKVATVHDMSESAGYPLRCVMEEE